MQFVGNPCIFNPTLSILWRFSTWIESWSRSAPLRSPSLWCLRSSGYKCDRFFEKCSHVISPLPRVTSLTGLRGSGCLGFLCVCYFFCCDKINFCPLLWSDCCHTGVIMLKSRYCNVLRRTENIKMSALWHWDTVNGESEPPSIWQDSFYHSFWEIHGVFFYFSWWESPLLTYLTWSTPLK